ncbi:MAG: recombinase family protein [Lewinellaceae bacterium]|nr:recombinase family protein [Lewinellaceae bacterium]
MKKVYGYIRVSTVKQGNGVSLQEQKEAIIRYAEKNDLHIIQWFEEKETAAKQGRTLFTKMMKLLRAGKAKGAIIHKIDRSARNLKDWAALGDLIDEGIEIHFAHESLDLDTRGGRLAADIQAVIASDYIRNLREEAIKGLYGRLKQGIYPFSAPIGYVNNGGGQLKTIDPVQGPLVKKAFELYASEKYNLESLVKVMDEFGLKNMNGNLISINAMSRMLNNPFYAGVLKVKGKTFAGKHEPLITPRLFAQIQNVLKGKTNTRYLKHDFLFRRKVKCVDCGRSLIGEKQKGHIYYRCQTKGCPTKTIREERIEKYLIRSLENLQLHDVENSILIELLEEAENNWSETQKGIKDSLLMQQSKISQKLERLTDAYIENAIDKELFERKKEKLLIEQQGLHHKIQCISGQKEAVFKKAKNYLELVKSLKKTYLIGILEEKREVIKIITSNLMIQGKKLMISMVSPYQEIGNRHSFSSCVLNHHTPRSCIPKIANTDINAPPQIVDNPELRESMRELLETIIAFFEKEAKKEGQDDYV